MKKTACLTLIFLLFLVAIMSCISKKTGNAPIYLKVEYQKNPINIDTQTPRFSWIVNDSTRGALQTAYQILVSTDTLSLSKNKANLWDSKKVLSGQSALVEYTGPVMNPATTYYWKVRTWDKEDKPSAYSGVASWKMGLLSNADWQSKWIAAEKDEYETPLRSVYMRGSVDLPQPVKSATIYASGLGSYVLYINGKRVGKDFFTPGWTHYPEKIQYQAYDITELLNEGENALGAVLGNMWWSSGLGWKGADRYSEGPLQLLVQAHITLADGTIIIAGTDENWKFTDSPILENHIYHGEKYDARLEIGNWNQPGFDDQNWTPVGLINNGESELVAQQAPKMQVTEEINPVSVNEPKPGHYVFDMGQNMVGIARLKVSGEAGDKITMRFAENLHKDGTVAQENLRKAKATDQYILKGNGMEEWEPLFTYHGFQYVEITGLREKPDISMITGKVIHTDAPVKGKFSCSNELINQIDRNITWGLRGNIMSVPTDCPQRDERLGWMGDAQMFAPTSNYKMNLARFYTKWTRDMVDCQDSSGYVYDVNPAIVVDGPAKPGWGDAVVIVPWMTYKFFGDLRILKENYDAMMEWVNYMKENSTDYIYEFGKDEWGGYGDWIAVEPSPTKPTGTAYFYYSSKLLSKIAQLLGNEEDAAMLKAQYEKIAKAYQDKYFDSETKEYEGATQTANLLPLAFGITPKELEAQIIRNVVDNVAERDTHLTTGFLGTGYILPMLSDYGYHELAYALASQTTYPSWGYMVEQGATTIWELWNSDTAPPESMNSRNHFALGSVGEWFYGYLAGIKPDIEAPGFKQIIFAPKPVGDLEWANASLKTAYGKAAIKWKINKKGLKVHLQVPANTTAKFEVPYLGAKASKITEGETVIFNETPVEGLGKEYTFIPDDEVILIGLGAGDYKFNIEY